MENRNAEKDKKRIKKGLKIILAAFLLLGIICAASYYLPDCLRGCDNDIIESEKFFAADYGKNIFDNEAYLALDRRIMYERYGLTLEASSSDPIDISPAAAMFYDYFNCIINGEYQNYKTFFTEDYVKNNSSKIPETFTMQAVYDIYCKLYSSSVSGDVQTEIYEVKYRIFENNGTFRSDILPGETRTLVFEIKITGNVAAINSIGFRKTVKYAE